MHDEKIRDENRNRRIRSRVREREDGGSEGKMRITEKEREKMAQIKGGTQFPGLLDGGSKLGLLA